MPLTTIEAPTPFADTTTTLGARLTAARNAKGLTQAALSEKLGVELATVEAWETGESEPRSNRIQMLAGLLNVSIMWLITGQSNGTDHIEQTHDRDPLINDALGEIAQLKDTLSAALDKLAALETRLQNDG